MHGMARTPLSLGLLAGRLRREGHDVSLGGYVAALEPFDAVCRRIRRRLEQIAETGEPYAVIGHSLGGLILRMAIAAAPSLTPAPRRLIMLGTPNQPPRLARRFRRLWPYRVINGQAGQLLADPAFYSRLPAIACPYTIIAGTGGRRGQRGLFGDELNDGTVAVTETLVSQGDEPVLVPARHTFMMNHPEVRKAILDALT